MTDPTPSTPSRDSRAEPRTARERAKQRIERFLDGWTALGSSTHPEVVSSVFVRKEDDPRELLVADLRAVLSEAAALPGRAALSRQIEGLRDGVGTIARDADGMAYDPAIRMRTAVLALVAEASTDSGEGLVRAIQSDWRIRAFPNPRPTGPEADAAIAACVSTLARLATPATEPQP